MLADIYVGRTVIKEGLQHKKGKKGNYEHTNIWYKKV